MTEDGATNANLASILAAASAMGCGHIIRRFFKEPTPQFRDQTEEERDKKLEKARLKREKRRTRK
jgi:hypothetical protein